MISSRVLRVMNSPIFKSHKDRNIMVRTAKMSSAVNTYETLKITIPKEYIYHVELNRPNKMNAMNAAMWMEIEKCFRTLDYDENCRVVVLSGAGKMFCAGLDLMDAGTIASELGEQNDVVRRAKILKKKINQYQNSMSSLEICRKPVLAAIHSACIGGATSLITATDMRYCTEDAWFQVKEVELGMAADVGVLQRLPKVIKSDSLARELCYTGRKFSAEEAYSAGLVSKVFKDKESMMAAVLSIADVIASKSPVAVQGTKANLVYSRDHTVQEGLDHVAAWNQMAMQSEDFMEATGALISKNENVIFSKL